MVSKLWILSALLFISKAEHLAWPSTENNPGKGFRPSFPSHCMVILISATSR
jgi:hypothetical protein